jgi:hypothetical protein
MRFRSLVVVCLGLLSMASLVSAQERSGGITGTIKDSSGAVLPGVTVTATSPTLVGIQTAVTDEQGIYRFPALTT